MKTNKYLKEYEEFKRRNSNTGISYEDWFELIYSGDILHNDEAEMEDDLEEWEGEKK